MTQEYADKQQLYKEWLIALLTSKYEKASFVLKITERLSLADTNRRNPPFITLPKPQYCATGVLCEIHRIKTGHGDWFEFLRGRWSYQVEGHVKSLKVTTPQEVCDWAQITRETIGLIEYTNDHSFSFEEPSIIIAKHALGSIKKPSKQELLDFTGLKLEETILAGKSGEQTCQDT